MDAIANLDVAEPAATRLTARLFSINGKMTVTLLDLSSEQAVAVTPAPPPAGSIAVVTRNSVRIPATVASADGRRFTLTLDEPLDDRRREQFVGGKPRAGHRRPPSDLQAVAA